jgi:Lrp/AsnC family transcriptional regulator, leucine-responsive regulatory protein
MNIKLDLYDKKILLELDINARIQSSEIAKKIKKSKQFVNYRIKKLEEQKIITGYNTVIDYSRLGFTSIRVYFKYQNITPREQEELESDLIKDNEVWWLVTAEGSVDVGYATAIKNILDFYAYWDEIMKKYKHFISKSQVSIYSHIRQFPKIYLLEKPNTEEGTLIGASTKVPHTRLEIKLLKLLANNARMSILEIASKLKTSPQTARGHIKKLQNNGIIQGYKALINASLFGYRYYKAFINLTDTTKRNDLEKFCMRHPNILNINRTIGGSDFEIELQAKTFSEFEKIMDEIKNAFKGSIKDYEFVIAKEEKKMNYFPFE